MPNEIIYTPENARKPEKGVSKLNLKEWVQEHNEQLVPLIVAACFLFAAAMKHYY